MIIDQLPFADPEFVENAEPRCPCLLLLDTSTSMHGRPIAELNEGLQAFKSQLMSDQMATQRVEIGIVTFGPVRVHTPFQTADAFSPPTLEANGDTPLGAAIDQGLDLLAARKRAIREAGIFLYRPWVFLITDGAPTDAWRTAAARVREGDNEQRKSFNFFAVGVEGADMHTLAQICSLDRPPLRLRGLDFRELFKWLSNSVSAVAKSQPGQRVALPPPSGWSAV